MPSVDWDKLRRERKGFKPYRSTWRRDIQQYRALTKPTLPKPVFKYLKTANEHFTAFAAWRLEFGQWLCVQADKPIFWMKGMTRTQARVELDRLECFLFQWSDTPFPESQMAHGRFVPNPMGVSVGPYKLEPHEKLTGLPYQQPGEVSGDAAGRSSLLTPVEA